VSELLEFVGLRPDQAHLYPHQFSGGQRQRIALARALSVRPRLIVLDEPVSALDVSIRAQILNLLRDLQAASGVSFLLIAHDLAPVRYMSHRVGVMYLGKIVEEGPARAIMSQPQHPYTQALYAAAATDIETSRQQAMIQGEPPSPINLPSGCRFRTRCPFAMAHCAEQEPELKEISKNHRVACHLY
jgi:oligopeptide/dipeptide ABC transporter ATP-binding protein